MGFIGKNIDTGHVNDMYGTYVFDSEPFLYEVIKELEWGANRLIRNGNIKIKDGRKANDILIRNWPVIADPHFKLKDQTLLAKGKGTGMGNIRFIRVINV